MQYNTNNELLGFDFFWKSKLIEDIRTKLKGQPQSYLYLTTKFLNNFYSRYKTYIKSDTFKPVLVVQEGKWPSFQPDTYYLSKQLEKDLKVPNMVVNAYLGSIYNLYKAGKIEEKIYNPKLDQGSILTNVANEYTSIYKIAKIAIPITLVLASLIAVSNLSKR